MSLTHCFSYVADIKQIYGYKSFHIDKINFLRGCSNFMATTVGIKIQSGRAFKVSLDDDEMSILFFF